ncbi:MAG TPA: acyltransferase [Edaphobacter sp.]|nr:acyltransferase [Edaphobacter sp.]
MRIPRLDGIRAIAILLVFFYHHRLLGGSGRAGVDLFFVLPGLLITRILRASSSKDHYWSRFYLKRSIRILPPLALLFALCLTLDPHMSLWTIAGYSLFLGNVMNITRYANELFLVLWSLAVEEHFYIFWPFAVKFLQRRTLITLVTCVLLIEPILRAAFTPYIQGETVYYLTPFRLDSLAAGSLPRTPDRECPRRESATTLEYHRNILRCLAACADSDLLCQTSHVTRIP